MPADTPVWIWIIVSVVLAVFGSSGFWAWFMKRHEKKDATTRLLIGMAQDRIKYLGRHHIEQKYIDHEDFETLNNMYEPYVELGGNGVAKRVMDQVRKLPSTPPE